LSLSLAGFKIVQLLVGVLGITLVTSEYSNGLIRLTLQSVRSRSSVVWAKATVFALVVLVVACFAAPAAFVVGRATYSGTAPAYSLGDSGVVRVIAGTIVYLVSIGLLGVALGFLIRSAAAAVGVLFASLLIVPALVGLLPGTVADTVTKLLPSNAGDALTSITRSSDLLSPVAGGIVLIVWVVGVLVAAVAVLQRRDA
jgi:ABC-2 type transport system permease protein